MSPIYQLAIIYYQQFVMKKSKPDKPTVPISMSAKKAGPLKHEMLFTPYKIEWKDIQPPANGQTSSRTFFNTMKNDLSNLKSDVERMIRKQAKQDIKQPRTGILEDSNNQRCRNNQKCQAFQQHKKDHQIQSEESSELNDQFNNVQINQEKEIRKKQQQIDILAKENKVQKNLITELKKENQQLYIQIEEKVKSQEELKKQLDKTDELKREVVDGLNCQISQLEKQIIALREENKTILINNNQLSQNLQQIEDLKKGNGELRLHNEYLEEKIEGLSQKMSLVTEKFKEKDLYIKELQAKIEAFKIAKRNHQIQQQQEKACLLEQLNQKLALQEKQFNEMFQDQVKNSKKQFIEQIQEIEARTKAAVQEMENQNIELAQKIQQLEQQVNKLNSQLQDHQLIAEKSESRSEICESKVQIDFSLLGAEFERKINELIEQNYSLKNKITSLESEIKTIQTCKQGLEEQIALYQQLDEQQNTKASLNELEKAIEEIYRLKKEKDNAVQEYEFKMIKLENELQQEKNKSQKSDPANQTTGINFNKILKEQLQENQDLKEKIKSQTREISSLANLLKEQEQKHCLLAEELAIEKMKTVLQNKGCNADDQQPNKVCDQNVNTLKYDLDQLKKKHEALNSMLDSKNRQIRSKEEFIERVLISKVNKKEQEEEIAYILREIRSMC